MTDEERASENGWDFDHAALIIVDYQHDFTPPDGTLAVTGGDEILPVINALLRRPFALKICTQDWHPQNHVSFASNHPPPDNIPFKSKFTYRNPDDADEAIESLLWPDHCIQDTPGADFVDGLDLSKVTHRIRKGQAPGIETYSAFHAPFTRARVGDTGLDHILTSNGIKHVFVAGLAMDFCVKATAIHSAEKGFRTYVIDDATRAVHDSPEEINQTRRELQNAGVKIIETALEGAEQP